MRIFFRRKHKELDERLVTARRERELSEERLSEVQAQSRKVLAAGKHNHFADAIRRRIAEGYSEK